MDVIQSIRNGYELDIGRPSEVQNALDRSLYLLGAQLYSHEIHFILEFVQNADDNRYLAGHIPSLTMRVEGSSMHIVSNETGFEEKHVRAICNIGDSTKKNNAGFIGEKGIGFKSVFKVAHVVHISSREFTFKFDCSAPLGMIAPIWEPNATKHPGETHFDLELITGDNGVTPGSTLSLQLQEINASLLLFLRTLRTITLETMVARNRVKTLLRREDLLDSVVKLSRTEAGALEVVNFYFMVKHTIDTSSVNEPKRPNIASSEVILAFPIASDSDHTPVIKSQQIHAFLPLRSMGFEFIIQADFLTSSNREDILQNHWNRALIHAIVDAFVETCIPRFMDDIALKYTWARYLPRNVLPGPFHIVQAEIIQRLSKMTVIEDSDGVYRRPSTVLIVPSHFRDGAQNPLIPPERLPPGHYYISTAYDVRCDEAHLKALGVKELSSDFFLTALGNIIFLHQSKKWLERVSSILLHHPAPSRWKRFDDRILSLQMLPLQGGRWVAAREASAYVFDLSVANVPGDVDLEHVSSAVVPHTKRHRLLEELGVGDADPKHVAVKILQLQRSLTDKHYSKQHVDFFYQHRSYYSFPSPTGLYLFPERGRAMIASALYLPTARLRELLPDAPFIDSMYLVGSREELEDRRAWLATIGLNTAPRVVDGKPSLEFVRMTERMQGRFLLVALSELWDSVGPKLQPAGLAQLSQIQVLGHRLDEMILRRSSLENYLPSEVSLPFIPVDDPDHSRWDFLSTLGVATGVGARFFIRLLVALQEAQVLDFKRVRDVYVQLQARLYEDERLIKSAFSDKALILLPGDGSSRSAKWVYSRDAVWSGPSSMRSQIPLTKFYSSLKSFFSTYLRIANAPASIVLDEAVELASRWKGLDVDAATQDRAKHLLSDISVLVSQKSISSAALAKVPIFPTSQGAVLRLHPLGELYVRSRLPRFGIFEGRVPLLSSSTSIECLLQSDGLSSLVRYLDKEARVTSTPVGTERFNSAHTATYADKYRFIKREVSRAKAPASPTAAQKALLKKLTELTVVDVDSIDSLWTLGETTTQSSDDLLFVDDTGTEVKVFVSQKALSVVGSAAKVDIGICLKLSQLLEIRATFRRFFQIIATPVQTLELLDSAERDIGDDSEDALAGALSWFSQPGPTSSNATSSLSVSTVSKPRLRVGETHSSLDVSSLRASIDSIGERLLESPHIVSPSIHKPLDVQSLSHVVKPNTNNCPGVGSFQSSVGSGSGDAGIPQTFASSPPSPTQFENGILGEYMVYKYLKSKFPRFTEANWTSELREYVDGFSPFVGTALADFTYVDYDGRMSELWRPSEQSQGCPSHSLTFHIEVKTTSGARRTPFHMSTAQLQSIIRLTQHEGKIPTDIYVLIRIWGIRSAKPESAVYVDPCAKLSDGSLAFVADVEIIPGA